MAPSIIVPGLNVGEKGPENFESTGINMDKSSEKSGLEPETALSIGTIINQSLAIVRARPIFFFGLAILALMPNCAFLFIDPINLLPLKVDGSDDRVEAACLFLDLLGQGLVTLAVFQSLLGREITAEVSLYQGFSRLQTILFVILLNFMIMAIFYFLLALGEWIFPGLEGSLPQLFLVIVFLIVVDCRLWLAVQICVIEEAGALDSFRRSIMLTKGHNLKIVGLILIFAFADIIIQELCGGLAGLVTPDRYLPLFFERMSNFIVLAFSWVALTVLYFELIKIKEGWPVDPRDQVADIFD